MKYDSIRNSIILAALLHDIGKLAQRGGEEFGQEEQKLAELFCPKKFNKPTHLHAVLSAKFIKEIFGKTWEKSENYAIRHHYPMEDEDKIIQLADWLSCGERRDRDFGEEVVEVQNEPLISIFSQIIIDGQSIEEYYCCSTQLITEIEKLFPVKNKNEAINSTYNFKNLWDDFKKESKKLMSDSQNFEILISKVLFLLEKYILFVPSSAYLDKPEISLFHHLKSTAAIATCLYDLKLSNLEEIISAYQLNDASFLNKKDFILLGGDISGIQDFIYSVTSEHALKGLRGRSFYLQLLSEIVAKNILDEFNLTLCNLVFLGGGNFTILLPNIEGVKEKIEKISEEINSKIFNAHNGKLGVIIAYVDFSYNEFSINKFGDVLKKLGEKLAREKRRKFKEILDDRFFMPYPEKIDKELKGCEICGKENEKEGICELCESFIELAKKIKKAKYIEIERIEKPQISKEVNQWYELIRSFGYNYWFKDDEDVLDFKNLIYLLNDTEFLNKNCCGFRFEAIWSPEGTLEDMSKKAKGIEKWGALRMDIDNLSKIFSEGLTNKTISRFSMLSYMVSLFFSLGIREIVEKNFKNCCVVYSGGDDLFILAPWSDLPNLAYCIYKNFRKYVGEHPKITLSAGIYISPTKKFPVYQAAKAAGQAEEKSKKEGKNKLTFLEKTIEWQELEELEKIKDKIVELIEGENLNQKEELKEKKKKMPRSLLTLLYSGLEDKEKMKISRIWLFLYGLKRLIDRYIKGEDEQIKLAIDLRDKFIKHNELKENLEVAVCWADYLTRKEVER
ncbi:MAG: type III-A CRISPR-associated protein Cas10/Csm1 [Candidatus Ratteibacteria bacterium]